MALLSLSQPRVPPLNSISPIRTHPCFIHGAGAHQNFPFKTVTTPSKLRVGPNSSSPTNTISEQQRGEVEEEDYLILTATRSEYNNIVILETENSKVLLLDESGNVHSILYKGKKWTNSYWDEFSSLPAIIPNGPVAIFGLGGGTVAHQLLDFWPSLNIDGWELDEILVDRARQFFGLSDLEKGNNGSGGVLRVCVGDALSPLASVEGGYAGILVDLFAGAKVLPQLEKVETWVEMREKLMPNGRIMVNCAGASDGINGGGVNRGWEVNLVIEAMCRALGGQLVNWKQMPENESRNYLALTGPLPDLEMWSASVPEKLSSAVKLWKPCEP